MGQTTERVRVLPSAVGRYLIQNGLAFAAYAIAGKLGQATTSIRSSNLGPVWPAYGIALAALLLCGYRVWAGIAAAAFVVAFLSPEPPLAALGQATGATIAALVGAFLLRHVAKFQLALSRLRDVLALIVFGALGSAMVSASIGVSVLYVTHVQAYFGIGSAWLIYWLGDATGVLLVTPLVLTIPSLLKIRSRARLTEFAVLMFFLTGACFIVFGDLPLIPVKLHVMAFAVLPFVVWAAIRFEAGGAALATLLVATMATVNTALGTGAFAQNNTFTNAVLLDVFFAVLSVSGMTMAAVITEREQAEKDREQFVRSQAAMEARLRLATIVESSNDAIIGKDVNGIVTDWNKGAERLYGYSAEEVIGTPISLLTPDGSVEDFPKIVEMLREGHVVKDFETVRQRKDGTRIEISLTVSPIKDSDGRIIGTSAIARDISERKQQEAILRESEERFRLAAEAGKVFAYEWDAVTDVLVRSAEAAKILGCEDNRPTVGQDVMKAVHPDDRERLTGAVADLSPEKPHLQISYRVVRPDGKVIWVERTSRAHFDENGKILRLVGMVADITERKRSEQALRESEERLRLAAQAGNMYAYEWDVATDIVTRSQEHVKVLEFSDHPDPVTRQQLAAWVHPDDRALFMGLADQVTPEHPTCQITYRVVRPDGSILWLEESARAFFDEPGKVLRMIGMVADITPRKQAEDALRRREESYRMFVAQTSEAIFCMEMVPPMPVNISEEEQIHHILFDSYMGECNDAMAEMYGVSSPKDFLGMRLTDMVVPDDPRNIELTRDYIRSGFRVLQRESHEEDAQGQSKVFMNSMIGIVENGKLIRTWGIQRDITERKRAEDALRESEERLRLAVQAGRMYVFEWNASTRAVIRSGECRTIINWLEDPTRDTTGQFTAQVHPDDREVYAALESELTPENPTYQNSYRLRRPDGSVVWLEERGHGFFDGQGKLLRTIGIVADITTRKVAEEALSDLSRRLIEAQEQERTRIARELHDDIGQRLALLAIELEQFQKNPTDVPAEAWNRMTGLRNKTAEIASDIQSLSHELHSAKLEYLGLGAAMKSFCKEFGEQQKAEIDFNIHDLPSPLPYEVSLCLFRVLQEALHNSAKHSGVRHFEVRSWGTPGEVHLTVGDSGAGFDREAAKETRGLGLISMEERLKLLNGILSINSQPNRGTTIHARVPLHERDSMRAAG